MSALKILIIVTACLLTATGAYAQISHARAKDIRVTDMKMASALDEKFMPVRVTKVFPCGTSRVFCWFRYRDARNNTKLLAKWHYITQDIRILDYSFDIDKDESYCSISLAMPEDRIFPTGKYRVNLTKDSRLLKSLTFIIR